MRFLLIYLLCSSLTTLSYASQACRSLFSQSLSPVEVVKNRTAEVIKEIESRSDALPLALTETNIFKIRAKRNDLTKILYSKKIIEASAESYKYQDKLIIYKILKHYIGKNLLDRFHPVTMGLKEFLSEQGLLDSKGVVRANRELIGEALKKKFPSGFIIKPTIGFASDGKSFFKDMSEVVELLADSERSELYDPDQYLNSFVHAKGKTSVSGEKFIIQGLLHGIEGLSDASPVGSMNEYRVHSFYDQVVEGATLSRWKLSADQNAVARINKYTQDFLNLLPKKFLNRQAWAFDVFEAPNGELTIIEINTNRGEETNWSGFLKNPKVLGGYIRHLEQKYGWRFEGFSGWRLRNDLANLQPALNAFVSKFWNKTVNSLLERIWKKSPDSINNEKTDLTVGEQIDD